MSTSRWVKYHNPLWNFHHQIAPIMYESDSSIGVSLPKFKGDFLNIQRSDQNLDITSRITMEEKLLALATFGGWWYSHSPTAKRIYQEVLVETILHTSTK